MIGSLTCLVRGFHVICSCFTPRSNRPNVQGSREEVGWIKLDGHRNEGKIFFCIQKPGLSKYKPIGGFSRLTQYLQFFRAVLKIIGLVSKYENRIYKKIGQHSSPPPFQRFSKEVFLRERSADIGNNFFEPPPMVRLKLWCTASECRRGSP